MEILLGLGGNLGDVAARFDLVCDRLRETGLLLATSGRYRSVAVGPPQPDYLNAALVVKLRQPPAALLTWCQEQEREAGRDRSREQRWGPRPLDIDLLMAPGLVCRSPQLTLPHPYFAVRAFALVPAAELRPQWIHPGCGVSLEVLAKQALDRDPNAVSVVGL